MTPRNRLITITRVKYDSMTVRLITIRSNHPLTPVTYTAKNWHNSNNVSNLNNSNNPNASKILSALNNCSYPNNGSKHGNNAFVKYGRICSTHFCTPSFRLNPVGILTAPFHIFFKHFCTPHFRLNPINLTTAGHVFSHPP